MTGPSHRAAFRSWFGLTETQTEVLAALYAAAGSFVTSDDVASLLGTRPGAVRWHIVKLRRALDVEAIDCVPACGYRLTESGMGECRAVLWQTGEELRMAN